LRNVIKRYVLFFLSLVVMGLGISLVTKSDLGTSSISSIPYVLSIIYPLSFGAFTFISNVTFVLLQILILRKDFPKNQYLQLIVGPFLGLFIDLGMFLFKWISPTYYLTKLLILLIGSIVLAFGIFLQLTADVITNPGEGIVKAIAIKTGKDFGNVKVVFDSILVLIAGIFSFIAKGSILGIREGTLITAIIVGPIIKGFRKLCDSVKCNIIEKWF